MAKLIIPTPLRGYVDNHDKVEIEGNTVKEAIGNLTVKFPKVKKYLLTDNGEIREFVRIFVGDTDVNDLDNENTKVESDIEISIVPAIAGGAIF